MITEKSFPAMGTINSITLFDNRVPHAAGDTREYLLRLNRTWTCFQQDSLISRINRAAGQTAVSADEDTLEILRQSKSFSELTRGAFDVTAGPVAALWKTALQRGTLPSDREIRQALGFVDRHDILLNEDAGTVMLRHAGQRIDLGGVAKGYAVDGLRRRLRQNGVHRALLNLGDNGRGLHGVDDVREGGSLPAGSFMGLSSKLNGFFNDVHDRVLLLLFSIIGMPAEILIRYVCLVAEILQFPKTLWAGKTLHKHLNGIRAVFREDRTISNRLGLSQANRLMAEVCGSTITLRPDQYNKQPFDYWRKEPNEKNVLALIPFVRNLIQYGRNRNISKTGDDYLFLTELLHEKANSGSITFRDIEPLYTEYMGIVQFDDSINLSDCVLERLYTICDGIQSTDASLESKIILAIGIRHRAECFLISEIKKYKGSLYWKQSSTAISTPDYLSKVYQSNRPQTRALIDAYHQFGQEDIVRIIDEVSIMTPESIHFNSFMYEPLLDMDISELFNLYRRVQALQT